MRTFRFDKLVRDKILPGMQAEGSVVIWRTLSEPEFVVELANKLEEEMAELHEKIGVNREKDLSELADIAEIYEAIRDLPMDDDTYELAKLAADEIDKGTDMWEIDLEELEEEREAKNLKFGAFVNRIFIEKISIDENNPWMQRYLESPDKYPEVL